MSKEFPRLSMIKEAAVRINPFIHRTPIFTCSTLNEMTGVTLYFKCENFQKVGAFKFRGACNTVFSLTEEEASRGVATHSSGNHAQALALAARLRGIPAYIVMPENAPTVKVAAVKGYGGIITFCEPTLEARESTLEKVVAETGATFVHPYNDFRVITGQATAALELLEEVPELDVVMAPVGGGGLLSGTALSVKYLSPATRVIGAEPAGADDAYRSWKAGYIIPSVNPKTIADGLLTSLGENTFAIIRQYVDDIVTVSEEAIIQAMRFIWERMKIIVEPSAAVPLGALLEKNNFPRGTRVGVILSGGNVDLEKLPW
ncbi:MAG: pyridoxal-phosphate dependent enzyme [Calditrichaeota bacterium]|nr:MAG: pyridoxal-phosphate dependent enzyme [Calditrichota bacterium]